MKRLLLTGGSGYLGQQILKTAIGWDVFPTYFTRPISHPNAHRLDLQDAVAVEALVNSVRPEAILHTACSNTSPEQIRAIVPSARHLALAAQRVNTRLVHCSSDIVFDGEHAPYADDARPHPIHAYGRAKAQAEALIAELCPSAVSVRPSLIWGLSPLDKQTRWLVEGVQRGDRVTLFTDEWRCPAHVSDVSAAVLELVARPEISGTMNLGGPRPLTRWDFGLKLLAALGLTPGPNVVAQTVAASGLPRARDVRLISARAQALLKTKMRGVDEVLSAPGVLPG
jgi:dTDP-4-dehydrorhamnose reductase